MADSGTGHVQLFEAAQSFEMGQRSFADRGPIDVQHAQARHALKGPQSGIVDLAACECQVSEADETLATSATRACHWRWARRSSTASRTSRCRWPGESRQLHIAVAPHRVRFEHITTRRKRHLKPAVFDCPAQDEGRKVKRSRAIFG